MFKIAQQRSLTKSAFQFFDLLQNQLNIQGNIFDPPPAKLGTNIINLDNPDEDVIGYFGVSDVSRDSLFIEHIFEDIVLSFMPDFKGLFSHIQ